MPLNIKYFPPNFRYVSRKSDFPAPVAGVITLPAGTNWYLTKDVDLTGDRIECAGAVAIVGASSETAFLRSTGLVATPLITTQHSLPIQNLSIEADIVFDIDGTGMPEPLAIDWYAFNIINSSVGTIKNASNFIINTSTWINSGGCILDGTIGTVSFGTSLFTVPAGVDAVTVADTCVIQRRIRAFKSTFSVGAGGSAYKIGALASIPVDMFILDDVGFTGASTTFVQGVVANDNRTRWTGCRGVTNDSNSASYSMLNNATPTVVGATNTYYKIAGNTTAGSLQRFTHSNNRATYTGILTRQFSMQAVCSFTTGANNVVLVRFHRYNSSNVLVDTSVGIPVTASSGAGRAESVTIIWDTPLNTGDYIEVHAANATAVNDIVFSELVPIIVGR